MITARFWISLGISLPVSRNFLVETSSNGLEVLGMMFGGFSGGLLRELFSGRYTLTRVAINTARTTRFPSSALVLLCGFIAAQTASLPCEAQSSVTLAWNPSASTDVVGYNIYYGVASQTYTNSVAVGDVTNGTISGLVSNTTYFFAATAVDGQGLESQDSTEISYTLGTNTPPPGNTPPNVSSIPDVTADAGAAIPPISFTISDAETPASNLTVAATSSNPALLPNSNITLSGADTNRSLTLNPVGGQTGTATITVSVCDPSLCTNTSFLLTVSSLPSIAMTSPTNGAVFQAPADIALSADVVSNGHTANQVEFLNGSNVLGTVTTAPYNFTWSAVPAGSYSVSAQLTYDGGRTVASAQVTINVGGPPGLPAPWQTSVVGTVASAGSASVSNGLYTVQGAGNINGSSDNFQYLFQTLSGDGEIRAQVESIQNTGANSIVGPMIRESLTSGSRYALMGVTTTGSFRWQKRSNTGGRTSNTKAGSANLPNGWTRLVRAGNTFSGYTSGDGTNWTLVNANTIGMATNIYIGLAVGSGTSSNLNTVLFTNVTVVP